jgi:TetR/AcrR family transcriptional regulator, tetracycline repressor protein
MRMVADELGVSAMAAYRHVPNRETLINWVVDENTKGVRIPDPGAGTWQERLRQVEKQAFLSALNLPGLGAAAGRVGPHQRRLIDSVLDTLREAGFDEEEAVIAFEVIWAYFWGQLRVYDTLVSAEGDIIHAPDGLWTGLATVMDTAPSISPAEYFDRGFDILLDGLTARLAAKHSAVG